MDFSRAITDTNGVRSHIASALAAVAHTVEKISRDIHAHPELSFQEHRAAAGLTALFSEAGFAVESGVADLPTAFTALAGSGEIVVGICVEYDALPDIGHACGHNLIAGASVGAALALLPFVDELGITLKVIGTPAEEHGGGKALMIERGVFDNVTMAMMVHPFAEGLSFNPAGTSSQVVGRYRATFQGKAAHAAAAPHLAINAADAAVIAQVAVGLLRQQLPETHRVAMFIAEAGFVTNIIPETAVVNFECRAFEMDQFTSTREKVRRCFEAGALATGASLEIVDVGPVYESLEQDETLCAAWNDAISFFGHSVERAPGLSGGSTDMGNVSQIIPSIHPWIGIPGVVSPVHSHNFTTSADSPEAYTAMMEAALSMAWMVASVTSEPTSTTALLAAATSRRASSSKGISL